MKLVFVVSVSTLTSAELSPESELLGLSLWYCDVFTYQLTFSLLKMLGLLFPFLVNPSKSEIEDSFPPQALGVVGSVFFFFSVLIKWITYGIYNSGQLWLTMLSIGGGERKWGIVCVSACVRTLSNKMRRQNLDQIHVHSVHFIWHCISCKVCVGKLVILCCTITVSTN